MDADPMELSSAVVDIVEGEPVGQQRILRATDRGSRGSDRRQPHSRQWSWSTPVLPPVEDNPGLLVSDPT